MIEKKRKFNLKMKGDKGQAQSTPIRYPTSSLVLGFDSGNNSKLHQIEVFHSRYTRSILSKIMYISEKMNIPLHSLPYALYSIAFVLLSRVILQSGHWGDKVAPIE